MSFDALLAQLAAATGAIPAPEADSDIVVTGKRKKPVLDGMGDLPRQDPVDVAEQRANRQPINLDNSEYRQAAAANADAAHKERKGMFGVKGTLRDVLGLFGDTYLTANGHAPIYKPQREAEANQDALSGFTEQPQQALERLASQDEPAAQKMYQGMQLNTIRQQQQEGLQQSRQSLADDRKFKQTQAFTNRFARMVSGAKSSEQLEAAIRLAKKSAGTLGINLEKLGITDDMSPEDIRAIANGDMTVNQQQQLPIAQQRADAASSQAGSARIRANRPPAGRAGPQPTAASMAAPLIAKMGKTGFQGLSAEEQDQARSLGFTPDRGKGKTRPVPDLPPALKGKIVRPVK